jgi:hypothetical protein
MIRSESGRKMENNKRKADARQATAQPLLGFNYYIEQLHQITVEQKSNLVGESFRGSPADEDNLEVFAQVLSLLWQNGAAYLDAFFVESEHKYDLEMKDSYAALQRMQTAGLVEISEGKVYLTEAGKDLMEDM